MVFLPGFAAPLEKTGQDPTKPAPDISQVDRQEDDRSFVLQSIIIDNGRPKAMINNRLVRVGDKIGAAKVIAIERNAVVLSEGGRKRILYLFTRGIWN